MIVIVKVIVIGRIFLFSFLLLSLLLILSPTANSCLECLGAFNAGGHLFSFRTQKLSPVVPMVVLLVSARVGRCQDFRDNVLNPLFEGIFYCEKWGMDIIFI